MGVELACALPGRAGAGSGLPLPFAAAPAAGTSRLTQMPLLPANNNQALTKLSVPPDDDHDDPPEARAGRPTQAAVDPDVALLLRAGQGDRLACSTIVERHLGRITAFAQRTLGQRSDAEDVAQETFLRLWRHAGDWTDQGAKVSTWLHQVALNLCRDRMRRKTTLPIEEALEQPSLDPGPGGHLQRQEVAGLVRRAIDRLPERQREALLLCHYQELGNAEAAGMLGVSVEALESLLARGRRALRQSLREAAPDLLGDVE